MPTLDRIKSFPYISAAAGLAGGTIIASRFVDSLHDIPGFETFLGASFYAAPVLSIGAGAIGVQDAFNKKRSGLSRVFSAAAGVAGLAPAVVIPVLAAGAQHGIGLGLGIIASVLTMTVSGSLNVVAGAVNAGKKGELRSPPKLWWAAPASLAAVFAVAAHMGNSSSEALTREFGKDYIGRASYSQKIKVTIEGDKLLAATREPEDNTQTQVELDLGKKQNICTTFNSPGSKPSHECASLSGYSKEDKRDLLRKVCDIAKTNENEAFLARHCRVQ